MAAASCTELVGWDMHLEGQAQRLSKHAELLFPAVPLGPRLLPQGSLVVPGHCLL